MHVFCCDLCFGSKCSGVSEFWCFLAEAAVRRVLRSNWFGSGLRFSVFCFFFFFFFFCKTRTGDSKEPLDSLLPLLFRSIERLVCLLVADTRDLFPCCRRLCDEIC
jgi:hypothetical protein